MNFLQELAWRGMLHDRTEGVDEVLRQGSALGYIGFDPTASSLTIGNYIQIMLLTIFQQHGHTPVVLMGGATGRIGDPSGKDSERQLKSYEELDRNLAHQEQQMRQLLNFDEGPNKAILVNNLDFYRDMNVLDFLRDVGKTLSINYMLAKDSVKNRIESGLSFTEFSYQLLQAYDFQCLYRQHNCVIQMGGSDQWGNITAGAEFIRRNLGAKAHAITTPLLTKSDGSKFGKSAEGNLWLDPALTSPYQFYQFWINTEDQDLPKFLRYFSLRSRSEIEALEQALVDDPNDVKRALAHEMTERIHGNDKLQSVLNTTELLFNKKANRDFLLHLELADWQMLTAEIPSYTIDKGQVEAGINIIDLLAESTTIVNSKGDGRRAIKGNAISVNKNKVTDHDFVIDAKELIRDTYLMIENGKKNKFVVQAQ